MLRYFVLAMSVEEGLRTWNKYKASLSASLPNDPYLILPADSWAFIKDLARRSSGATLLFASGSGKHPLLIDVFSEWGRGEHLFSSVWPSRRVDHLRQQLAACVKVESHVISKDEMPVQGHGECVLPARVVAAMPQPAKGTGAVYECTVTGHDVNPAAVVEDIVRGIAAGWATGRDNAEAAKKRKKPARPYQPKDFWLNNAVEGNRQERLAALDQPHMGAMPMFAYWER